MNLKKKHKILFSIVVSLIFIYLVFGFFILPKIVKSQIVGKLSELTQSEVTLEKVKFNPLSLTASLGDFKLSKEKKDIVAFKELHVDLSISSVVRRSLNFSEITLNEPYLNLVISSGGRLNLLDLVPEDSKEKKEKTGDDGIFPVLIKKIAFDNGNIVFEDLSNKTPYTSEIKSLSFILSNFSTLPDEKGLYELEATLNNRALIDWKGSLNLNPVSSSGSIRFEKIGAQNLWEYIQDRVNFVVTGGDINFEGKYVVDFSKEEKIISLKDSNVMLNSFTMLENPEGGEVISVPELNVNGINFDLVSKTLDISKITTTGGKINGIIDENGTLNFAKLAGAEENKEKIPEDEVQKPKAESSASQPVNLNIKEIDLADYVLNFEDKSLQSPTKFSLSPTNLNIRDFSLANAKSIVVFSTVLNESGKINVQGELQSPDFTSDMTLNFTDIPLKPFEPYINEFAEISIENGTLSFDGRLINLMEDNRRNIKYTGNLDINSFQSKQPGVEDDLLNWSELKVSKAEFDLNSFLLSVENIDVDKLNTNIVISADGKANLTQVIKSSEEKEAVKAEKTVETESAESEEKQFITKISEINIKNSRMDFADFSVDPNFKTSIDDMNVTLKGLSSRDLQTAKINLTGKVDKYAPIEIKGEINPLGDKTRTDIDLDLEGLELTNLNSYSGKHVGYKMDRGKLSLNLEYMLNEKLLDGKNRIVFDQIKLGSKVDSPDAVDLPLELAISLLKDSSGAVKLDFPVSGDPTDPKFNVTDIVFKTFFNLIFKAVTSPFSILGSIVGIFGSGEDLSQVGFEPGSSVLTEKEINDLDNLSEALSKRPNLKLEIRGTAFDNVDRLALAERQIIMDVRDEDEDPGKPLTEDEIEDILEIYENDFAIDPLDNVPKKDASGEKIPKMERLRTAYNNSIGKLKDFETVKDQSMIDLARNRAESIRDYISTKGNIEQERIFTLDPSIESGSTPEAVNVPLSVGKF